MKITPLGFLAQIMSGVSLLVLPAIIHSHTAKADDLLAPCNVVAEYLREFATRTPGSATSDANFPFNALASNAEDQRVAFVASSDGFENLDAVELAFTPLKITTDLRDFIRTESLDDGGSSYWYVRDGRRLGNLLSLSKTAGTARCEYGIIIDTTDATPKILYPFGGEETCDGFGGHFELTKIGALVYPTIVTFAGQDGWFESQVSLLPRSGVLLDRPKSQCTVTIQFDKFDAVIEWKMGRRDADATLRETVKALVLANQEELQQETDPKIIFKQLLAQSSSSNDGTGLFDRLIRISEGTSSRSDETVTTEEIQSFFSGDDWPIEGQYLPLEIDGQKVIFALGYRNLGWRYRDYMTAAFWLLDGEHVFLIGSADFLAKASQPRMSVSGQQTD